jgi:hypothetical protein
MGPLATCHHSTLLEYALIICLGAYTMSTMPHGASLGKGHISKYVEHALNQVSLPKCFNDETCLQIGGMCLE